LLFIYDARFCEKTHFGGQKIQQNNDSGETKLWQAVCVNVKWRNKEDCTECRTKIYIFFEIKKELQKILEYWKLPPNRGL
jgi:hypothetical protein